MTEEEKTFLSGAAPPHNPEKNIKTKYEKTNTTRRKRPPCPSFLNASITLIRHPWMVLSVARRHSWMFLSGI